MHQIQPSLYAKLAGLCAGLALSGAVLAAPQAAKTTADTPTPQVELKTTMGDIVLELNREKAPRSVDNFLAYVKAGTYKGTIFHRVIDGFMIQGGGYDEKLKPRPTNKPVPIESKNGLSNVKYSLAMARNGDPNSATSQWFINVDDNTPLDFPGPDGSGGYTVFGKVIKGQETVDKIKGVLVDDKGIFQNIPVIPIVVKSATILKTPIQPKL
ncbi:peptidylprolyl isomerase [Duganella callida]|uniref:Peptidyl-prolyl cis-trans isomerase n=1 Tax=Duganella callida TaxID=2561932 RepID=A0A4Y9SU71_9BURK|nr:peptidylprolyl isomerase [Duganella callida]TFW30005.1 peptidyl-prolyl cis-trans isomerase [Duganella callida]